MSRIPSRLMLLLPVLLSACGAGARPAADPTARVLISGPVLGPDGSSLCATFPAASIRVLAEDTTGRAVESSEGRCPTDNFFLVVPPGIYTLRVAAAPDTLSATRREAHRVEALQDVELAVRVGSGVGE